MRFTFAMVCLVIYFCSVKGHKKSHGQVCRYWCRSNDDRYYCCPTDKNEGWMVHAWHSFLRPLLWVSTDEQPVWYSSWPEIFLENKKAKKHCPPLRTHCPRTYDWYSPPTLCYSDEDCGESEKCCYDVCLEHKTCKHGE